MARHKLVVTEVSHNFTTKQGSFKVLSSLNLDIKPGEFVSLVGPSGCGKSTLFNLIAGVIQPTTGQISIDDQPPAARLGLTGYMPQKPLLLPWKTVRQNVMLGPELRGPQTKLTIQKADSLLKKFGLAEFADQYPRVLSGGMAQKAALLRTIMSHQDFLLMDEPFGALDAITRLEMQLWLLHIWRDMKSTALLITHDIREAILLSDRIYVLSQRPGTIIKEIAVPLPRPRDKHSLSLKTAIKLETTLESLLLP